MFKKIFYFGLSLAFLTACNTKFSVNGEYEEKAIVHFLLDQGQEFHFLKLNRTFLKEGNANEFAKEPELSYFDNVVATVEEVKNGSVQRSWTLQDTTINNKEDGAFYSPEQKLYFFKADDLDENAFYRLHIDVDNGNHIITGQTELLKGVNIKYPMSNQSFNFAESDVPQNGYRSTNITFTKSSNASVFKLSLRFDYEEFTNEGQEEKSIEWNIGTINSSNISSNTATISAKGEPFYKLIKNNIEENSAVTKRKVKGIQTFLVAGSNDLYTYMLTNEPTSSLAQNQPTYSNVDGALGIFSTRYTLKQYRNVFSPANNGRALNQNSTKELCNGQYTAALKFCSDIPLDNNTSYSCN